MTMNNVYKRFIKTGGRINLCSYKNAKIKVKTLYNFITLFSYKHTFNLHMYACIRKQRSISKLKQTLN